jgi:hypothetical protein
MVLVADQKVPEHRDILRGAIGWQLWGSKNGWAAEMVGQPSGAGEVGLETPKAWSVLLAWTC